MLSCGSAPFGLPPRPAQIEFEDLSYNVEVPVLGKSVANIGTAVTGMLHPKETKTRAVLSKCRSVATRCARRLLAPPPRCRAELLLLCSANSLSLRASLTRVCMCPRCALCVSAAASCLRHP